MKKLNNLINMLGESRSLAFATSLFFVALLMSCVEGAEGDAADVVSIVEETSESDATGTVYGHVEDTNGNPLAEVEVYLGAQSTVTDVGGNYVFYNVPVINTVGADENISSQPLVITIIAPDNYLGSTVTVSPMAQINDSEAGADGVVTVFMDGFAAQAGTAVLPERSAKVVGMLRDNASGVGIADATVGLTLQNVNGANVMAVQDGSVTSSYQTLNYQAISGSDGWFEINSVPTDSQLQFVVSNYTVDSVSANTADNSNDNILTTDDIPQINVGTVYATSIVSLDNIAPYVVGVAGVLDPSVSPASLDRDVSATSGIEITFSESLQSDDLDSSSVVLRNISSNLYLTVNSVTISDAGVLTLSAATNFSSGDLLHLNLQRSDFKDSAGNVLVLGVLTDDGGDDISIAYDELISSQNGTNDVLRLNLQAFQDINTNAQTPEATQMTRDDSGEDYIQAVQLSSTAFNDVDDTTDGFQQLNSADNDDAADGVNVRTSSSDAADRLSDLASALNNGTQIDVSTNVARVSFTPTNASYYSIKVTDSNGNTLDNAAGVTVKIKTTVGVNLETTAAGSYDNVGSEDNLSSDDGSDIELLLEGVVPGDMLIITPYDDLTYAGTAKQLVLVDNVEPTTILQNSYDVGDDVYQIGSVYFGEGGGLASEDDGTVGLPVLHVTPQLLDNLDGSGRDITAGLSDGVVNWGGADDSLKAELFDLITFDEEVVSGNYAGQGGSDGIYDTTAWTAFSTTDDWLGRTIGVAFSEDISIVEGNTPQFSGSSTIFNDWAGMVTQNDVTQNSEGDTNVNADIVRLEVDDVMDLANNHSGEELNFSSVVQDDSGNIASDGANARIRFQDAMPPFVTAANYYGASFVITFNEPINESSYWGENLYLYSGSDTSATLTLALSEENVTYDADNYAISIVPASPDDYPGGSGSSGVWVGDLDASVLFDLSTGAENDNVDDVYYSQLRFDSIQDSQGNSWIDDSAELGRPDFAVVDSLGEFDSRVSSSANGFIVGEDSGLDNIEWIFSHALDFEKTFDGCASNSSELAKLTLTAVDSASCFKLYDNFGNELTYAGANNNSEGTISSNGKTFTFFLDLDNGITVGDGYEIRWAEQAISSYDTTETRNVPDLEATTP